MDDGFELDDIGLAQVEASVQMIHKLKGVLEDKKARVLDLFRQWDKDFDGSVTKKEVHKALSRENLVKHTRERAVSGIGPSASPNSRGRPSAVP